MEQASSAFAIVFVLSLIFAIIGQVQMRKRHITYKSTNKQGFIITKREKYIKWITLALWILCVCSFIIVVALQATLNY